MGKCKLNTNCSIKTESLPLCFELPSRFPISKLGECKNTFQRVKSVLVNPVRPKGPDLLHRFLGVLSSGTADEFGRKGFPMKARFSISHLGMRN